MSMTGRNKNEKNWLSVCNLAKVFEVGKKKNQTKNKVQFIEYHDVKS